MTEYLISRFRHKKPGVLSRGYKRRTRGFRLAAAGDNAATLGDEPYQLFLKFKEVPVAVAEERALGIAELINAKECEWIVLDDGFQHRAVTPRFSVLLSDYNKLFIEDRLLPVGRLRESRKSSKRADAIVVTKCPDLSQEQRAALTKAIQNYSPAPVFFSKIHYSPLIPFGGGSRRSKAILVSGLANADSFRNYCEKQFQVIRHFDFPDHYRYSAEVIAGIEKEAGINEAMLVTTEKDYVKLMTDIRHKDWFYYSIQMEFLDNENEFLALTNLIVWGK